MGGRAPKTERAFGLGAMGRDIATTSLASTCLVMRRQLPLRVVQVVAGKRRAELFEDRDELPRSIASPRT